MIVFYLIYFVGFFGFSILVPVIPLYTSHLGASVTQVGIISAAYFYIPAFLMIPFGLLADRIGKRALLAAGLVIFTIIPIPYILVTSVEQLIFIRIIHGLGPAMFIPISVAVVVDMAPVQKRGQVLGMAFAAGQIALMAGPLTGGILVDKFGFNAAFYTCFTVSLIGLVVTLLRYKVLPTKQQISVDSDEKSWSWLKKRIVVATLMIPLLVAAGSNTINTYMPLYGQTLGIDETGVGLIIAVFYASSAVMQVPAGRLIDRIGPKPIILIGLALCALALATYSRFHTLPQFCIISVFFGFGVGMSMPGALFLTSAQAPINMRSMAMAMFTSVFQIGLALGTTIMGFVADATGFQTMFLVSSGSLALGWLSAIVLTRDKRQAS